MVRARVERFDGERHVWRGGKGQGERRMDRGEAERVTRAFRKGSELEELLWRLAIEVAITRESKQ